MSIEIPLGVYEVDLKNPENKKGRQNCLLRVQWLVPLLFRGLWEFRNQWIPASLENGPLATELARPRRAAKRLQIVNSRDSASKGPKSFYLGILRHETIRV